MRRYKLPDGEEVYVGILDESGGDVPELGPVWEVRTGGVQSEEAAGHPLNSLLAGVLGWNVAHEEWPEWINDLAEMIEADWH